VKGKWLCSYLHRYQFHRRLGTIARTFIKTNVKHRYYHYWCHLHSFFDILLSEKNGQLSLSSSMCTSLFSLVVNGRTYDKFVVYRHLCPSDEPE